MRLISKSLKVLTFFALLNLVALSLHANTIATKANGHSNDYLPMIQDDGNLNARALQQDHGVTTINDLSAKKTDQSIALALNTIDSSTVIQGTKPIRFPLPPGKRPVQRHPRPPVSDDPNALPYGLTLDGRDNLSDQDFQFLRNDLALFPQATLQGISGFTIIISTIPTTPAVILNGKIILTIAPGQAFPYGQALLSAVSKNQWAHMNSDQQSLFGQQADAISFFVPAYVKWYNQLISNDTGSNATAILQALFVGALNAQKTSVPFVTFGTDLAAQTLSKSDLNFHYTTSQLQIGDLIYTLKDDPDPKNKGGKLIIGITYNGPKPSVITGLSFSMPQVLLDLLSPLIS